MLNHSESLKTIITPDESFGFYDEIELELLMCGVGRGMQKSQKEYSISISVYKRTHHNF